MGNCIGIMLRFSCIYYIHNEIKVFDSPSHHVYMRLTLLRPPPFWMSTCLRHDVYTSLSSGPELRFDYDNYNCNLFKTVLLIIYITNLYWRKISFFIPSENKLWYKNINFFA